MLVTLIAVANSSSNHLFSLPIWNQPRALFVCACGTPLGQNLAFPVYQVLQGVSLITIIHNMAYQHGA